MLIRQQSMEYAGILRERTKKSPIIGGFFVWNECYLVSAVSVLISNREVHPYGFGFRLLVRTELKTKMSGRFLDSVYSNWMPFSL